MSRKLSGFRYFGGAHISRIQGKGGFFFFSEIATQESPESWNHGRSKISKEYGCRVYGLKHHAIKTFNSVHFPFTLNCCSSWFVLFKEFSCFSDLKRLNLCLRFILTSLVQCDAKLLRIFFPCTMCFLFCHFLILEENLRGECDSKSFNSLF